MDVQLQNVTLNVVNKDLMKSIEILKKEIENMNLIQNSKSESNIEEEKDESVQEIISLNAELKKVKSEILDSKTKIEELISSNKLLSAEKDNYVTS